MTRAVYTRKLSDHKWMGCASNLKGWSFKDLVDQNPKVEFRLNIPYPSKVVSCQLGSQNTSYSQKDYIYQPSLKVCGFVVY